MGIPRSLPLRLYLGSLVALSVALTVGSCVSLLTGWNARGDVGLVAGFTLLIALATSRPVKLQPHVKLSLRVAPQLVAAVLLGPALALLATAAGVLAGYLYLLARDRSNRTDLVFNTAQSILSTAAATILYTLIMSIAPAPLREPLALLLAAESIHLSTTLLVAAAIVLSGQDTGFGMTVGRLITTSMLQYSALLGSGILAVLLVRAALWAVPLLFVPVVLVERTLMAERAEAERVRAVAEVEHQVVRRSEERFRALVGNVSDVLVILARSGSIRYISPSVERVWSRTATSLQGGDGWHLIHPEDRVRAQELFTQSLMRPGVNLMTEVRVEYGDGSWHPCELIAHNLLDDPSVQGVVLTYHDTTERKHFEQTLTELAFYDVLSKLPNRALFMARLEHALTQNQRRTDQIAVLFLDLDDFKIINDTLGHQAGDALLLAVAERLLSCVRPTDTVARLGGDEFTILLEATGDLTRATAAAERIQGELRKPFVIGGQDEFISVSIGIATSTATDESADGLLRNADQAMYQAKGSGKGHSAVFDHRHTVQALARQAWENDVRRALEGGEFELMYQPVIDIATGRTAEVEALVRWHHPTRGLLLPGEFIPLAEESGFILHLGRWVLEEACRQARNWQQSAPSDPPLIMAVNLSGRQFGDPHLLMMIEETLRRTGLSAGCLKLELTESMLMQDSEQASATLDAIKALGVKLALDDFGTGYCSFTYLQRFPIDSLKIDRSFITGLGHHPKETAIVEAIIAFANALTLIVTAEGIETSDQLTRLGALRCEQGQGYYFSKPVAAAVLQQFLHETRVARVLAA